MIEILAYIMNYRLFLELDHWVYQFRQFDICKWLIQHRLQDIQHLYWQLLLDCRN